MSPAVSLWFFLLLSLSLALIFNIFPLSHLADHLRPEFVCLMVLYWTCAAPQRLGIAFAFTVGLVQSFIEANVWGGYSLALCVSSYLCLKNLVRFRNYSLLHQSLWLFVWVFIHQIVVSWVQGLSGYDISLWSQLASAVSTALCWPFCFIFFNWLRRSYHLD